MTTTTSKRANGGPIAAETERAAEHLTAAQRDDREARLRSLDLAVRGGIGGGAREIVSAGEKIYAFVAGSPAGGDATKAPLPGATIESIARICHEANRALQEAAGEDQVSPPWDDAPEYQRESSMEGVRTALAGATPEDLHEAWRTAREAAGWTHGTEKDEGKKTHPCLVDYDDLPAEQQLKDQVFAAIVAACAPTAGHGG